MQDNVSDCVEEAQNMIHLPGIVKQQISGEIQTSEDESQPEKDLAPQKQDVGTGYTNTYMSWTKM